VGVFEMAASRIITRREPLNEKAIKGVMFFAVAAAVVFGRDLVWEYLRTQDPIYQNEWMVSFVSLVVGIIVGWITVFLIKRRSKII
jgi:prolipoprotein diacylglyceryltransferase